MQTISQYKKHKNQTIIILVFSIFMILTALTATADNTTLTIDPSTQTVSTSKTFSIDVYCFPTEPIKGFELEISFDKSLVKAVSVNDGDMFDSFHYSFSSGNIDNSAGLIENIYGFIIGPGNTSNPGTFCTITFSSKSYGGTSKLKFNSEWTGVVNESGYLSIDMVDGSVKIDGPNKPPPVSPGTPPITPTTEEQNFPPETPEKPSGSTFIELGVEYEYETSTFDADDDEVRIKFDWGDGNFSEWSELIPSESSISSSHVWNSVSTFSVRTIAQDEHGYNSSWSPVLNVTVSQVDNETIPIPNINVIYNSTTNETITFDGLETFDPDGIIVTYYWDFGDGNNGTGETLIHKYQNPGDYIVTLTVFDDKGNNYSNSKTITVYEEAGQPAQQESNDSKTATPFLSTNLIIGIFIFILLLIIIVLRKNIKKFVASYLIDLFSKILKESKLRKIQKIDNKINKIKEKINEIGFHLKQTGIDTKTSILHETMPIYTTADISQDTESIDKEDKYDIDIYNYRTGEKFDRFFLDSLKTNSAFDKSKQQIKDEEEIEVLVDRLLLSKILEKHSFTSVTDLEKTVDNHLPSKDLNEN